MKLHTMLIFGVLLSLTGCAEKEQRPAEPVDEPSAATTDANAVESENAVWRNEALVEHMHLHAEKLDDLNFALADGDLEAAKLSANWLSTHDTNSDIQSDWMPYLYRLRTEAQTVEAAADIATAQAAAQNIIIQCNECHAAVGISAQLN